MDKKPSKMKNRFAKWTKFHITTSIAIAFFCSTAASSPISTQVEKYGILSDGTEVYQYSLKNGQIGLKAINYGGIITEISVPDRDGKLSNVVLGYDDLRSYETKNRFFGAIVGRYANRIRNGRALIDGKQVPLSKNKGIHQIHGGAKGFDKVFWQGKTESGKDFSRLVLSYKSVAGEEGFPGNLDVTVTYTLLTDNTLKVDYLATTDAPTVVNLTQHSYFNLRPETQQDVLSHQLKTYSSKFFPIDKEGFPVKPAKLVAGTPFDFSRFKTIGSALNEHDEQLEFAKGIDHYFLRPPPSNFPEMAEMAVLKDDVSGRQLSVSSTARGMQIYSANYLNESVVGRSGQKYKIHQGICLETGEYPNAPAEPSFPSTEITPDRPFQSSTVFRFSVAN